MQSDRKTFRRFWFHPLTATRRSPILDPAGVFYPQNSLASFAPCNLRILQGTPLRSVLTSVQCTTSYSYKLISSDCMRCRQFAQLIHSSAAAINRSLYRLRSLNDPRGYHSNVAYTLFSSRHYITRIIQSSMCALCCMQQG